MSKWMEKYSCSFKHDQLQMLKAEIEKLLATDPESDDDKMHLSLLAEVKDRLYIKLVKYQPEYRISFTPGQAIALRIMYTDYIMKPTGYLENKMHTIAFEVHNQYA